MAISIHQSFTKNNTLHYNSFYPWHIRSSAEERVKRHSFYFGFYIIIKALFPQDFLSAIVSILKIRSDDFKYKICGKASVKIFYA